MPYIDEGCLDDAGWLAQQDRAGTLRALASAGAQVREARFLADEAGVERLRSWDRPRSVLVASVGVSAAVAAVLEMLAEPASPVPVTARRNVPLPGWVGALDLVVAVSLSGRSPGALALAAEAARRGASLLTVGAVDSPLEAVTRQARGVHVGVGLGRVSSRTSLWSLLTPVLMGAHRLGLVSVPDSDLDAAIARLDEVAEAARPSSESFVNPAKSLALGLSECVPTVLGDSPLNGVAAQRAASMFSRTARIPTTFGEIPDMASQVVATFDGPFTAGGGQGAGVSAADDIFADPYLDGPAQPRLGLLMLREPNQPASTPDEAQRLALVDGIVETAQQAGVSVHEVFAEPGPAVARLAGQMALTDFAATYLALGMGADPSLSRHVSVLRDFTGR
ncbi:bifunctional phosphoglucose/phosphomannose isomerase [Dermatophilus congolensis]|uniref:Bifunctional phosphoglucose/phosphomannose isomerase n=1 Tax=Dermatophilus congolensis TaxID=1863 RepID=A0A239VI96_9MICO|nr:SIS domain-containing protein [Dermatophilus congolensis]SNV21660.1 bifunctional phosphoglucose/phosphomannose isomerase [Dermatophilus congolensis]